MGATQDGVGEAEPHELSVQAALGRLHSLLTCRRPLACDVWPVVYEEVGRDHGLVSGQHDLLQEVRAKVLLHPGELHGEQTEGESAVRPGHRPSWGPTRERDYPTGRGGNRLSGRQCDLSASQC